MKTCFTTLLLSLGLTTALTAAPISFDFKDPKGVNAIQFSLDSVLEPIIGTAGGVSGVVIFDPANPAATTGRIVVAASSLVVPNETMTQHLLGKLWLDTENYPEISFKLASLENIKTSGDTTVAIAVGKFNLKGVTQNIKVPVKLTYLAGALGKRFNKPELKGDLLVLRGEFTIARADYGIQPGKNEDKVSPEIKLTLAIVGNAPQA